MLFTTERTLIHFTCNIQSCYAIYSLQMMLALSVQANSCPILAFRY